MKLLRGLIWCFLIPEELYLFKLYCKVQNIHSLLIFFPLFPPFSCFYYVSKRTRYILAAMESAIKWCEEMKEITSSLNSVMIKINMWIYSACRLLMMLTEKTNKSLSLLLKSERVNFPYTVIYVWIYIPIKKTREERVLAILAVNLVS